MKSRFETELVNGFQAPRARIAKVFKPLWEHGRWRLPRRPTVRILVVVDGDVGVAPDAGFGVGKMAEILRKNPPHTDTEFSYVKFEVEFASRDDAPSSGTATYTEFRFDQLVDGQPLIDQFDQIWCFGFHPGNSGVADDAPIEAHTTKLSNDELRVLTTWMNERKGGVLAMGDHHFLGATLAGKIPRVRSMRRWTNADGVPPRNGQITSPGGPTRYRHDTNQPQTPAQANPSATAEIPNWAEGDDIPQPIELRYYGGFLRRPHPILCGGALGAIDVLPDHPHEGWVYEDDEMLVDSAYDFGAGIAGPDFPDAVDGGSRPLPQAIAWANPWPEPPYEHEKLETPVTRFAVIGAYDGHRADVGRVGVDSTWHHWFNMNIDGLEDAAIGGTPAAVDNWAKIKTYYRNMAVWLSPPAKQRSMLTYAAFWSLTAPRAIEGYDAGMPSWELGETARDLLGQTVNSCTLTDWILPYIPEALIERFRLPIPDTCLTCPPFDFIENAVLGGLIKAMLPERERLIAERLAGKVGSVNVERLAMAVEKGGTAGLKELQRYWRQSLEHSQTMLERFDDAPCAARTSKSTLKAILAELALQDVGAEKGD